ncbi:uncharacterized protein LOC120015144 isoform X2 [Tripterygium wilfordii]|uniref:uncharacterized protein LOC120015144 isoform X2 n=1 Tax=Tripterygium wilfordii TaxID=458696 RepID=UPI0018F81099|nr:uncharacterized protein LOC120015144 isoform X2 [Tripterygium wilfordii]
MANRMMAQQPLGSGSTLHQPNQKLIATGNKDSSSNGKHQSAKEVPNHFAALRSTKCFEETGNAANAALGNSEDEFIPTKDKIPPNDESECHSFSQHSETMIENKGFDHDDPPPKQVLEAAAPTVTPKINISEDKSLEKGMIALNIGDAPKQDEQGFPSDDSDLVTVPGYRVEEASAPVLKSILKKHGDIAVNSSMKSLKIRSFLLEQVCEIVRKLQAKKFKNLVQSEIEQMLAIVDDLKSANIEIGWLHKRLEDILETKQQVQNLPALKKAMSKSVRRAKVKKTKLADYATELLAIEERLKLTKEKISLTENELIAAQADAKKDQETYLDVQNKKEYFVEHPLVDGLL